MSQNQKAKEEFLEKLKDKIEEIQRESVKGCYFAMKLIISKYLPEKENKLVVVDDDLKSQTIKKTLLKLIAQFHPDKHFGIKMIDAVLYEEITKTLTNHYNNLKLG